MSIPELDQTFKATWGLAIKVVSALVLGAAAVISFNSKMTGVLQRMDSQSNQFDVMQTGMEGLTTEVQKLRSDLDQQKHLQEDVRKLQEQQIELYKLVIEEIKK